MGERTAEQIKIEVGSALTELDEPPEDYAVRGRDLMTGIPKEIQVSYAEIAMALDKSISKIEEAILSCLENTPPELSADIYKTGIFLAGGGALASRIGQADQLQDKAAGARGRRALAGCGPGNGHRPQECREFRLPDARVTPACRCGTSGCSSNETRFHSPSSP